MIETPETWETADSFQSRVLAQQLFESRLVMQVLEARVESLEIILADALKGGLN